ncbi:sigma-70 family RNA polymerase sigma factor [Photobacterium kishitanii]|uniref:FliA/WhiG family RNA polymerase sigma factor n=1 Tax=Photobacterium kishitanii TaxID=318456 RepID=A0A2T3KMT5_9GAMM|nr:sigma-70 family RNA polymerase sigma factor [Photobacterium kishitanii]PSV01113.1 hypothetical protein C9J27_03580 [Photobacterium kishitanii]
MNKKKYSKSDKDIESSYAVHKRFVLRILNQLIRSHGFIVNSSEMDDLMQVGLINLLELHRKYDDSLEIPFHSYAKTRIRYGFIDWFRKNSAIPRRDQAIFKQYNSLIKGHNNCGSSISLSEMAHQLGISTDKLSAKQLQWESRISQQVEETDEAHLHANDEFNPETFFLIEENRKLIIEALSFLSDRERSILSLYYYDEMPLKDISKKVDLTESRISQIKNEAIIKIKNRIG